MANHYTNALPSATLPNLTTNGFRSSVQTTATNTEPAALEPPAVEPPVAQISLLEDDFPQEMLRSYAIEAKNQIQLYRLDAFVGGLLIGTHLPKIGWMMLSYTATFPVLIAFQHADVFIQLYKKKPEYFIVLVSGLVACQVYALYCIRNLIF
uniref:Uncharacterized protein n=1 Tax=viral metagenome TaxID=1070528 RepID=A0A6C0LND4_9ZZZZ